MCKLIDFAFVVLQLFTFKFRGTSCCVELLDKLQKRIWRIVCPSLAVSLEPLVHCRNIGSLSLFYRYYFGICSSELTQLVRLPYSRGRSTCYSDRLHVILSPFLDLTRMYVNSFFPRTVSSCFPRLWISLPIECLPLTCDLDGFKARINRHLLTVQFLSKEISVML